MATTTAPTQTAGLRSARQPGGEGRSGPTGVGEAECWLSLAGGGALALFGLTRGSLGGLGLAALGGCLAYRGATGEFPSLAALGLGKGQTGGVRVERAYTINKPREELYRFWRNFENLPRFMRYLDSVRTTGGNRSHWVARGPLEVPVEWDAEITADRPNELIAWRSLPGSMVDTEGEVRFTPAPGNRGTEVKVVMRYDLPAGKTGAALAWLTGRSGGQEVSEDLRRFKRLMETGEIPTTKGQPSGRGRDEYEQTGVMVLHDRLARGLGWFSIALGLAEAVMPRAFGKFIGVGEQPVLLPLVGLREIATGVGILKNAWPAGWLWGRVAGDAMDLALLGGALASSRTEKGRVAGALAAVLGVTAMDVLSSLQLTRNVAGAEMG